MLFEYISLILGIIKIIIYKILNYKRLVWKIIPKMNSSFKLTIKKHSKLLIGSNFRSRNNVSFRIYNRGIIEVGDNCFFNDGCSLNCQESIKIGNNVIFGQNVMVFDHDHDYKNNINNFVRKNVAIGNNVWIGANVVILKGVTIGDNCVIAAGTIVTKSIPSNSLIYQKREEIIKKVSKDE